ncbi:MAG: hypothetical protein KC561_15325 [Myxococcales bacterium]|nr:hypothetical protein [Myxococcales bacterium]
MGIFLVQHAGRERRIERVLEGTGGDEVFTLYLDPDDEARGVDDGPTLSRLVLTNNTLPNAVITVDGVTAGTGAGEFETELAPGAHRVRVCQAGYYCDEDLVRMVAGETQTWVAPSMLTAVEVGAPVGGIVTSVLAAGAVGTGIVFILDSGSTRGDADDLRAAGDTAGADELDSDADTSAIIGYSALGAGVVLGVVSAILFVNHGPDDDVASQLRDVPRFGAAPGRDGWQFSFETSF